jgi:hypothetical protein
VHFNAFAGGSVQEGGGEQIISRVIKIFMIFAGSFAVLAMVYAGLLYTYSNGEEESADSSPKTYLVPCYSGSNYYDALLLRSVDHRRNTVFVLANILIFIIFP